MRLLAKRRVSGNQTCVCWPKDVCLETKHASAGEKKGCVAGNRCLLAKRRGVWLATGVFWPKEVCLETRQVSAGEWLSEENGGVFVFGGVEVVYFQAEGAD